MNIEALKLLASADVYREGTLAGTIKRDAQGAEFVFAPEFVTAAARGDRLAFHLPFTQPRHRTQGVNLHPFFAGLLPEGLRLRALVKKVRTSEDDLLSLLIAAGADCVGDVAVVAPGEKPELSPGDTDTAKLDTVSFRELFSQSLQYGTAAAKPFATVPGAQEKVSASTISFPLRGRSPKRRGAWILKLNPEPMPRLVENEAFFLQAARDCGLETAAAKLAHDRDGNSGLLVERFDRVDGRKVHQEDACQFLNRYPADKYRLGSREIAEGIHTWSSTPVIDIARFVQLTAFSYVIGNGDLHGKNVSLRVAPGSGRVSLTPAYDLVSTVPYGDSTMCLEFEGRTDNLKRKHFVEFAERHGVSPAAMEPILKRIYERIPASISNLEEIGYDVKKTAHLRRVMMKRREDLEYCNPS